MSYNNCIEAILNKWGEGMKINVEAFRNLVDSKFQGSNLVCAKALCVAPSTVWRVVKGNNGAGVKLMSNLVQYCQNNNLNYTDYIFLE